MNEYDNINIDEIVQAILESSDECTSTLPADPKHVKRFVPEEEDAFKVRDEIIFGIRKPTWINTCRVEA